MLLLKQKIILELQREKSGKVRDYCIEDHKCFKEVGVALTGNAKL